MYPSRQAQVPLAHVPSFSQFVELLQLALTTVQIETACIVTFTVADPGLPVGGRRAIGGGADLRHGCFLAKTYAKMKELDPVGGGGGRMPAAPPGSASDPIAFLHDFCCKRTIVKDIILATKSGNSDLLSNYKGTVHNFWYG